MTQLEAPKLVAVATDSYMNPYISFPDAANLPSGTVTPCYGQDLSYGTDRSAPKGHNVGSREADLIPKMRQLLSEFASNDSSGMASRLFEEFLDKNRTVEYFDDPSLSSAAAQHSNIQYFCSAAISAPVSPHRSQGKTRVHQALRDAGWDINQISVPTDLGVPAFNQGSKAWGTGDFGNGLGVMINGIQRAYVIADSYCYDAESKTYDISLRFIFYDVFGLDDEDLEEYGAMRDGIFNTDAGVGITAWWQLQHQYGYAPLVTRIILTQRLNQVPAV